MVGENFVANLGNSSSHYILLAIFNHCVVQSSGRGKLFGGLGPIRQYLTHPILYIGAVRANLPKLSLPKCFLHQFAKILPYQNFALYGS